MGHSRLGIFAATCIVALSLTANAWAAAPADFAGNHRVTLVGTGNEEVPIGQLRVERRGDGDGYAFTFNLDEAKFAERFLAMRPFRCLENEATALCHFPYAGAGHITADDLVDLEYQLMFLRKPRAALSLDSRNGVYYEMRWTAEGIDGVMRIVDMEPIIVPGAERRRPIRHEQLEAAEAASAWLPYLRIR